MNRNLELHLARHADSAWSEVIRPWLGATRDRLVRSYVIVATRGQAHGLKHRCLREGVPLLGVEFLTPGLARKKWAETGGDCRPALGREVLLFGLRAAIARRLETAVPGERAWGFWQSLQSDPERALDDFDALLQAGLGAADFPLAPLREIFADLTDWVGALGYAFAATEAHRAAGRTTAAAARRGRVLVAGLGAEAVGEAANVLAFVHRCVDVAVVLPAPEFAGPTTPDERWIAWWEQRLGTGPLPLDVADPFTAGAGAAALLETGAGDVAAVRVLVGRSRDDEMALVAGEIDRLLRTGAENIAVIFPRLDAAHAALVRALGERRIPFTDLLPAAGQPESEVSQLRSLLGFWSEGSVVAGLLALWPWLEADGLAPVPLAEARRLCERSFDRCQTHGVAAHLPLWEAAAPEFATWVRRLRPDWPDTVTVVAAAARVRAVCAELGLAEPEHWSQLERIFRPDAAAYPVGIVLAALASFLPRSQSPEQTGSHGGFARVTLTSRRRAAGLAWSHVVFAEANASVWPGREEASCWLTDLQRTELAPRATVPGLFTAEEQARLERAGYAALARDARDGVIFSAAATLPEDPELPQAPNRWLDAVLRAQGVAAPGTAPDELLARLVRTQPAAREPDAAGAQWCAVWSGRRDASRPFDEYFFAGDPALVTPARLPARLIERAVKDPAEFWFEAVLRVQRIGWEPFARTRRKALGQCAHEILAAVLRPAGPTVRGFGELPSPEEAAARLDGVLAAARVAWPENRYWDSCAAELARVCRVLLGNAFAVDAGRFVATEAWLPAGALLEVGGLQLPVAGRLDLVRLDRPDWRGAQVDIFDFKTGGDAELSARRMGRSGAALQLGVYLAAVRSLGIAGGRVHMIKPEPGAVTSLGLPELDEALGRLPWLGEALRRGVYGALTPDRSDYAPAGPPWPTACTPVPAAVLARKFAVTFPGFSGGADDE
ncbi:MAG: hypothetical protein B9S34_14145 [Opitutia bacterium Tous-C1TDCM]|nr:MAG: hypothetical protein B9S34_14145 [Opitutae bacterium Tous-C1TDCM]